MYVFTLCLCCQLHSAFFLLLLLYFIQTRFPDFLKSIDSIQKRDILETRTRKRKYETETSKKKPQKQLAQFIYMGITDAAPTRHKKHRKKPSRLLQGYYIACYSISHRAAIALGHGRKKSIYISKFIFLSKLVTIQCCVRCRFFPYSCPFFPQRRGSFQKEHPARIRTGRVEHARAPRRGSIRSRASSGCYCVVGSFFSPFFLSVPHKPTRNVTAGWFGYKNRRRGVTLRSAKVYPICYILLWKT